MEEQKDDSRLDNYTNKKVEEGIQKLLEEKELKIKWRNEIENNVSLQNYLDSFRANSKDDFVSNYINQKYFWYTYGDMYKRFADKERSRWIDSAHEHLEVILQKKLFDLQCLWRADEVQLEGVSICFDFDILEDNIFNCPFLELITKDEIAMYQDFLLKGDYEFQRYSFDDNWQDYDSMKVAYQSENSESTMPEWYEFHNLRTGNTRLFLLPDSRGEKEGFYIDLWRKNQRENLKVVAENPAVAIDNRPPISMLNKEAIAFVAKTFDDQETQKMHSYYTEDNSDNDDDEYYDEMFRELLDAKEIIPIKAHYNFKEAIEIALRAYKSKKIAEHLPLAHEQYLFNNKMGFSVGKADDFLYQLKEKYVEMILGGRELNGESRNFDF